MEISDNKTSANEALNISSKIFSSGTNIGGLRNSSDVITNVGDYSSYYDNDGYILCFNTPNGDGGFDGLDYESDGNVYDPSINSYDKFYSRDPGLIQKDVTLNIDYDK